VGIRQGASGTGVHHTPGEISLDRWRCRIINSREHLTQRGLRLKLSREGQHHSLKHESRDSDLPPISLFSNEVFRWHEHRVKEHLVELFIAADLLQRSGGNTLRLHIDEKVREPLVLPLCIARAAENETPISDMREASPDLLSG
jgi:hypothetical protein